MKTKMLWEIAMPWAGFIVDELRPHCERIEIVGSLRRNKPEVGDIEILAIPKTGVDMFGLKVLEPHALDQADYSNIGKVLKGGSKYKQIETHENINLDLFICTPPAQWGVLKLIRTGPAEYSQKFVTQKSQGGMLPGHLQVRNGAIWQGNFVCPCPEEKDVFELLGVPYVEPKDRAA